MQPSDIFFRFFTFLLPPAIIGTAYLYLYPLFQNCSFPQAKHAEAACYFGDEVKHAIPGETAPFRLLAFADPQIEGDTSLPGGAAAWWDVQSTAQWYRKRLDLWGNDLYLAHVYRSMRWFTDPTHVVVLGDLLGSQWISDEEFARRSERFWKRVFRGGEKVPERVMRSSASKAGVLGKKSESGWRNRIITVAGNHDIGYAGDVNVQRVERFEKRFGRVNWDITFALNETAPKQTGGRLGGSNTMGASSPELRLVVLNSMNLDEPAWDDDLQQESRAFLTNKLYMDIPPADTGTIILTHIPLHKEAGICTDGPFVKHFSQKDGGGIKEQNHLSYTMSEVILGGVVGPELTRKGIVLNGHDHTGCETYHSRDTAVDVESFLNDSVPTADETWYAKPYHNAAAEVLDSTLAGVREVTVRSMMGQYWGNAGLLSAWWDRETNEWKFDYSTCVCGIQHIWWGVHVLDIVVLGSGILAVVLGILEIKAEERAEMRAKVDVERRKKIS